MINLIRLPVCFIVAVGIAGTLFWVMQFLLQIGDRDEAVTSPPVLLENIRLIEEPPPETPPTTQRAPALQPATPALPATQLSIADNPPQAALTLPSFEAPVSITGKPQPGVLTGVASGNALAAFGTGDDGFNGAELIPISSARPKYPRSAAARKIEGWVELIFIVSGEGRVSNVRVLDASPRGVFEDAAVAAMSNWLFAPFYVDGKPVAREGTQLLRFRTEDIQDNYLWDD